jgi:hypothetical protein
VQRTRAARPPAPLTDPGGAWHASALRPRLDVDTAPLADLLAILPPAADLVLADDASSGPESLSAAGAGIGGAVGGAGGAGYLCSCFLYLRAGRPHNLWLLARWRALQALSGSCKNQPALNRLARRGPRHGGGPWGVRALLGSGTV